ncbi:MAG: hypothetical protein ACTHJR_20785 [Sphingomonas sp.]
MATLVPAIPASGLHAQSMPPAGYLGPAGPPVAAVAEPGAPSLAAITDDAFPHLFSIAPGYPRKDAHVSVIGAYTIAETKGSHVTAAWSRGYLPVSLSFSDGRCFDFTADYNGPHLSNARLTRVACGTPWKDGATPPAPPAGSRLRLAGTNWGYVDWVDDKAGVSTITGPFAKTYQPFFTAQMPTMAIMAMNGVDYPGGNMTLVGRYRGRLSVVVLEVGY